MSLGRTANPRLYRPCDAVAKGRSTETFQTTQVVLERFLVHLWNSFFICTSTGCRFRAAPVGRIVSRAIWPDTEFGCMPGEEAGLKLVHLPHLLETLSRVNLSGSKE